MVYTGNMGELTFAGGIVMSDAVAEHWDHPALVFPLNITMPCGETFVVGDAASAPRASVPCSCGDPRHWFVKIREEA